MNALQEVGYAQLWRKMVKQLPYTGLWQHDIFKGDHTPYSADEIKVLKEATGNIGGVAASRKNMNPAR